jgi:hypothetical protein
MTDNRDETQAEPVPEIETTEDEGVQDVETEGGTTANTNADVAIGQPTPVTEGEPEV